ncbi:MAG: hypothetical protein BJ554DRAFT_646, partial [Olpidium bornovanus]
QRRQTDNPHSGQDRALRHRRPRRDARLHRFQVRRPPLRRTREGSGGELVPEGRGRGEVKKQKRGAQAPFRPLPASVRRRKGERSRRRLKVVLGDPGKGEGGWC